MIEGAVTQQWNFKLQVDTQPIFKRKKNLLGRKLRLRHFRNGTELPWLATDDNYDFDFQQNRPLLEEITILPGDQLTYGINKYLARFDKSATYFNQNRMHFQPNEC